jgi:hypothetical protein
VIAGFVPLPRSGRRDLPVKDLAVWLRYHGLRLVQQRGRIGVISIHNY